MNLQKTVNPQKGFTLTELMVALAIAGIMIGIAMPSFTGFLEGRRQKDITDTLAGTFRYARAEAISRNTNVTIDLTATRWTVKANGVEIRVVDAADGKISLSYDIATITYLPSGFADFNLPKVNKVDVCNKADPNNYFGSRINVALNGSVSITELGGCS